jgi:hypothetical protein
MKRHITIALLAALSFSGCTNSMSMLTTPKTAPAPKQYQQPTPEKTGAYQDTMRRVASGIKNDPNYHRIALDTPEKKAWFKDLTYRLWDRQISYSQFISEGLGKYPDHSYEFNFVAKGFQKHS